jgi:hypothetical protein
MTTTASATQTMHARSPEDVLAAVPLVLGFLPEESVVMLTCGAAEPFHARLDLPRTGRQRRAAATTLATPAERHGVERVLFVLYTGDRVRARSCARTLVRLFAARGIEVVDVLRSDGRRWFPVPLSGTLADGAGTPYDVSGHVFTARAVAGGHVTLASREELAATVAADPDAVLEVRAAAVGLAAADPVTADPVTSARWLGGAVAEHANSSDPPDPATLARMLMAVRDQTVRDSVLAFVDRADAERQLPVWSSLVRAAPPDLVAPAASALAFLAWLAGDGALAWCALDRAAEGDPPCALADRVAQALEQALPPSVWDRTRGAPPHVDTLRSTTRP